MTLLRGMLILDAPELPDSRFDVDIIEVALGGVLIHASGGVPLVPWLVEDAGPRDDASGAVVRVYVPGGGSVDPRSSGGGGAGVGE